MEHMKRYLSYFWLGLPIALGSLVIGVFFAMAVEFLHGYIGILALPLTIFVLSSFLIGYFRYADIERSKEIKQLLGEKQNQ